MKIAILGNGQVGSALGDKWILAGHDVVYGVREPSAANQATLVGSVAVSEIVVLAVPGMAVTEELFRGMDLEGKILVDLVNPVNSDFTGLDTGSDFSHAAKLARWLPGVRVVKAFNMVGFNIMADPIVDGVPATMLIAGDDSDAKAAVMTLASDVGFAPEDAGPLVQAHYLEALAWLWISMAMKFGHGRDMAFVLHKR